MTVWIETPFDNLPAEGYGKMRYWSMAESFVDAGHEVFLFASSFNHGTKAPRRLDTRPFASSPRSGSGPLVSPCGIRLILVETPPYTRNVSLKRALSHLSHARSFLKTAKNLVSSGVSSVPSVVIAAAPTLSAARSAGIVSAMYGAKFVIDIQDAWPETFYRLFPRKFSFAAKALFYPLGVLARRLYSSADLVTGVSRRYAAVSGRDDFFLSYLGRSMPENHALRFPPGGDAKRLVYVGGLGPGCALETVIDALSYDAKISLDVAGAGEKEKSLVARARKKGVSERVRFHGYLEEDKLKTLLSSCDAGVIPMMDESFVALPNKFFDYIASSLPVISSLHGELGALVLESGMGELYDVSSPRSFIEALGRIYSRPSEKSPVPGFLRSEEIYPSFVRRVEEILPPVSGGRTCVRVPCST